MIEPDTNFVSSWSYYSCKNYCSVDHFLSGTNNEEITCTACSGVCAACRNIESNCLYCKYSN